MGGEGDRHVKGRVTPWVAALRDQGAQFLFPTLAKAPVVNGTDPTSLIRVVLQGSQAAVTAARAMSGIDADASAAGPLTALGSAFTQPYVLLGLGLYGLGAMVWMLVLAKLDVSVAYPFVALGFVVVMVLGAIVFGEPITNAKLLGTALVGVGVWLIARG